LRRGNLDVLDILDYEFASLRTQRQQKDFFSGLLMRPEYATDRSLLCQG